SIIGISVPVQNPSNPFTAPDHTSPGGFDPRPADTRVTSAPPETGVTTNLRDRGSEVALRTNKITADVTAASLGTEVITTVRDRASQAALRTNKITAEGPASFQGFVK